jgi:hypothetical protein
MAGTRSRYLRLSAVFASAVMASASPALAQGPGVDNPGPNVGNFGTCVVTQALIPGVVHPSVFARSQEPGVFIERGEDDFFVPKEGIACSVGLFPPPPGVGQP